MTDGLDMKAFNQQLIGRFRESAGVGTLGPVDFGHLVLLTTAGPRSGQPRTVPLGFARDEDGALLLFASNMGAPTDPDWYRNIEADPHVTVELTATAFEAAAEILHGGDRDAAYRRWIEMAPHVAEHEDKAGRQIPLVRVRRP